MLEQHRERSHQTSNHTIQRFKPVILDEEADNPHGNRGVPAGKQDGLDESSQQFLDLLARPTVIT